MSFVLALILTSLPLSSLGYRILCVSNMEPSHINEMHHAVTDLINKGHQVYSVIPSNYPADKKAQYARQGTIQVLEYHVPGNRFEFAEFEKLLTEIVFNGSSTRTIDQIGGAAVYEYCKFMMEDESFLRNVKDLKFDFAIVDGFVMAPCQSILPYHLSIPYASYFTNIDTLTYRIPALPSFQPFDLFQMSDNMSFQQRLFNTIVYMIIGITGVPGASNRELLDLYAPGLDWGDLSRNSKLYIVTRDHIAENPGVSMPFVISLPGVTGKQPNALNEDYENIFTKSTNGVILVSFGSMFSSLPDKPMQKLITTFGKLKATVIFKVSEDRLGMKVPKNVHLKTWIPQNDILGHSNTKLFITHCGNNGRYEAIYHGVPMLAFPLFAEQHHNAFMIQHKGYGKMMNMLDFTVEELENNINEILDDSKYRTTTKLASEIIKSRPMTSQETVSYWVEHVIKFGADHLRSHALNMPLYSFWMLDVIGLALIVLILILSICFIVCRKIASYFSKSRKLKSS